MRIILGADHGGFVSKERIRDYLSGKGFEVVDVGAMEINQDDDFVDYAKEAIERFEDGDRLILFCRNGFGMSIVANRYRGVRCGVGFDNQAVIKGRSDDDINCLSVPTDYIDEEKMREIVDSFLTGEFSDDPKYQRRINKIDN